MTLMLKEDVIYLFDVSEYVFRSVYLYRTHLPFKDHYTDDEVNRLMMVKATITRQEKEREEDGKLRTIVIIRDYCKPYGVSREYFDSRGGLPQNVSENDAEP